MNRTFWQLTTLAAKAFFFVFRVESGDDDGTTFTIPDGKMDPSKSFAVLVARQDNSSGSSGSGGAGGGGGGCFIATATCGSLFEPCIVLVVGLVGVIGVVVRRRIRHIYKI